MKATKQQIMTASNLRAPEEGRSEALTASHKAAKGTLVASGVIAYTLKQQNRLLSNYTAGEEVKEADVDVNDLDFAGMM